MIFLKKKNKDNGLWGAIFTFIFLYLCFQEAWKKSGQMEPLGEKHVWLCLFSFCNVFTLSHQVLY